MSNETKRSYSIGFAGSEPAPANWYLFVDNTSATEASGETYGPHTEDFARRMLREFQSIAPGKVTELGNMQGASPEDVVAKSEAELAVLTTEYNAWQIKQGLNLGSADEHLFDENLSEDQTKWLADFCQRWEAASTVYTNGGVKQGRDLQ